MKAMVGTTLRKAATGAVLMAAMLPLTARYGLVSYKPWFTAANVAGAPKLREGVWRYMPVPEKEPCAFDEAKPVKAWPACARAMGVTASRLTLLNGITGPKVSGDTATFVMGPGDPPLMQIYSRPDPKQPGYEYIWARVDKTDAQGRITAFRGWRVLCGPPTPQGAKATFYPGVSDENGNCLAASVAALQAAAKSTETDDTADRVAAHWVRAGSR